MKILVVGDYISDVYTFGTATRLCPEAPVPVIVPNQESRRDGGAGLVFTQLYELVTDKINLDHRYGSYSAKYRYFAGRQMICRVDNDSYAVSVPQPYQADLMRQDVIVICDYGKGGMTQALARQLIETGKPCFVDAKPHWSWYHGKNVTIFPNHLEATPVSETPPGIFQSFEYGRIVNKLGRDGCRLNDADHKDFTIPAAVNEVVDVTGAGDIFMAGFVYAWTLRLPAEDCLRFANELAGESCRHLGTYVVPREFAQGVLDRLRASRQSGEQSQSSSDHSTLPEIPLCEFDRQRYAILPEYDNLHASLRQGIKDRPIGPDNHENAQTLPQSPLSPTEWIDILNREGQRTQHEQGNSPQLEQNTQSSTDSERQREHIPARDRVLHPGKS